MFDVLISRKLYKTHITSKEIGEYLRKFKNEDIKEFIIFLEHILYLKNTTRKNTPILERKYEIPIFFRQVKKIG
jgi:chorismate-pyruvate lyase